MESGDIAADRRDEIDLLAGRVEPEHRRALRGPPQVRFPDGLARIAVRCFAVIFALDQVGHVVAVDVGQMHRAAGARERGRQRLLADRKGSRNARVVGLERTIWLSQEDVPVDPAVVDVVEQDVFAAVLVVVDRRAELRLDERWIRRPVRVGHPILDESQFRLREVLRRSLVARDEPPGEGILWRAQGRVGVRHHEVVEAVSIDIGEQGARPPRRGCEDVRRDLAESRLAALVLKPRGRVADSVAGALFYLGQERSARGGTQRIGERIASDQFLPRPHHLDLLQAKRALERHPARVEGANVGRVLRSIHELHGARGFESWRAVESGIANLVERIFGDVLACIRKAIPVGHRVAAAVASNSGQPRARYTAQPERPAAVGGSVLGHEPRRGKDFKGARRAVHVGVMPDHLGKGVRHGAVFDAPRRLPDDHQRPPIEAQLIFGVILDGSNHSILREIFGASRDR